MPAIRRKALFFGLALAVAASAFVGFLLARQNTADVAVAPPASSVVRVAASAYPLAYLAEQIGGSLVSVTTVTPVGGEPHDYEPASADVIAVRQADLFLFVGSGFDPWAEDLSADLPASGATIVALSKALGLPKVSGAVDPHFWIDPVLFARAGEQIRDALASLDSAHTDGYRRNFEEIQAELFALDARYREILESCRLDAIITAHDAFRHLGERYGIAVYAIAGSSPESEPSPRRIAELTTIARERGIAHVFAEPLVSADVAETLAREFDAQVLFLNPIEGLTAEEAASGATYATIMEENLQNLIFALQCL